MVESNKVLFINRYIPPWPGGSSKVMEGYLRTIEPESFTVISEELAGGPSWESSAVEKNILRVPGQAVGPLGAWKSIKDVRKAACGELASNKYRAAWLVYPNPVFFVGGYLACREYKVPYTVYMHDTWTEACRHKSWPHRLLAKLYEKRIMAGAEKVLAISHGLADYLGRAHKRQVEVLPHPVEEELMFSPQTPGKILPQGGVLKLGFTGGVYPMNNQALQLVLEALESWGKPYEFHLSSQSTTEQLLEMGIPVEKIQKHFFPAREDYFEFLESMDVLVSGISFDSSMAADERLTALPTKTFEYARFGKPMLVVAPEESTTARHARKWGYGLVASTGTKVEICSLLDRLLKEHGWVNQSLRSQANLVRSHRPQALLKGVPGLGLKFKE